MIRALLLVAIVSLTGCASVLTGYDSESKLTCAISQGVPCTPVSKVYAMTQAGTLPSQQAREGVAPAAQPMHLSAKPMASAMSSGAPSSGMPIRTDPRVLRLWIAPWEDDNGSLHDQQFVYVTLDSGRWVIEHNQRSIIDQYRPTSLRQGSNPGPASAPEATKPTKVK